MLLRLLLASLAGPVLSAAATYPVINTKYGPVRGGASEYTDGVTVYKGIPFAAPPTDENRWKAPSAPAP